MTLWGREYRTDGDDDRPPKYQPRLVECPFCGAHLRYKHPSAHLLDCSETPREVRE